MKFVLGYARHCFTAGTNYQKAVDKPLKGKRELRIALLLVGLCPVAYTRVPAHAAVDEVVNK